MKTQKLTLEIDADEEITLGLVRLAKEVPDYELFYHLNTLNTFQFKRVNDLVFHGTYYDYYYPKFEAFHHDSKICIHYIANKSDHSVLKKASTELFVNEGDTKFLLENYEDVDYIISTSEPFGDFSVILLPENLMFQIQDFHLCPSVELYHLIQYYE
ncbi:IPExxxVDY family protein [Kaistella carnis]|uniref:IPExxxVDY family protein n=1 Tax=Kaistella carnis TaxID=1241979 RepID=UPI0028A78E18|nr:IPExxxVDY family protein [Kaistella carnis]